MKEEFKILVDDIKCINDFILYGKDNTFYISKEKHKTSYTKDSIYKIVDVCILTKTKSKPRSEEDSIKESNAEFTSESYLVNFVILCGDGSIDSFYLWIVMNNNSSFLENVTKRLSLIFEIKNLNEVINGRY